MDGAIVAANISASVAVVGVIVSIWSTQRKVRLETRKVRLETRKLNLEANTKAHNLVLDIQKLQKDFETIRQAQFSETLRKRLDSYPKVWGVIHNFTINWNEDSPRDLHWVESFLTSINQVDTEYGVFFSEAVYQRFRQLQDLLFEMKQRLSKNPTKPVSFVELKMVDTIFRGSPRTPGLAAFLKDDLGSYRDLSIQARTPTPNSIAVVNIQANEESSSSESSPNQVFFGGGGCSGISTEIGDNELKKIADIRYNWRNTTGGALLTLTEGVSAITYLLDNQPEFNGILGSLKTYLETVKGLSGIKPTESLILSGRLDLFRLDDLCNFIKERFGVSLVTNEYEVPEPAVFDTLLELAAILTLRRRQDQMKSPQAARPESGSN